MTMVQDLAAAAHDIYRVYCRATGDYSVLPWKEAPDWQRDLTEHAVRSILEDPEIEPSSVHREIVAFLRSQGWVSGERHCPRLKTDPYLVAYLDLPLKERLRPEFFKTVVLCCIPLVIPE